MNSLRAFLSPCAIINAENELHAGTLNVLIQNGQPARVFDRTLQPQPFVIAPIDDPEFLDEIDVAFFALITEQPEWIVVVDGANQVHGIIEPRRTKDLHVAARVTTKKDEFGTLTPPPFGTIEVSVSYYGCSEHPGVGRFALHQIGVPIPHCPHCGKPMIKLQEKGKRAKTRRGK